MTLGDFVNGNDGWWGLLGLPLALGALVTAVAQIRVGLSTLTTSDEAKWSATKLLLSRSQIPLFPHERELIKGTFLPLRLVDDHGGSLGVDPIAVVGDRVREGHSVRVVGAAGSGKTAIALRLRHCVAADSASDYLIDVLSAKQWYKPPLGRRMTLSEWAGRTLSRRYGTFSRSYFNQLIEQGKLILAIDGYDELDTKSTESMGRAIAEHAARLPLVVFTRPETAGLESSRQEASFGGMTDVTVMPLSEVVASRLIRQSVRWHADIQGAVNLEGFRRLVTNPLRLHVMLKTWGDRGDARELLGSSNPEEQLWKEFVARFVDRSPLAARWPHFPRQVRALALVSDSGTAGFALYDSLYRRRAAGITWAACAAVLLPLSYVGDFPALGLVMCCALWYGLKDSFEGVVYALPRKLFHQVTWLSQLLFMALVVLEFAVLYQAARLVSSQYYAISQLSYRDQAGRLTPLWQNLLDPTVLSLYVDGYGSTVLRDNVTPFFALGTGACAAAVAASGLFSARLDPLQSFNDVLPGFDRLFGRYPLLPRVLVAVALLAIPSAPVALWWLGAASLAVVVHRAVTYLSFARFVRANPVGIFRGNSALSGTGLAQYDRGTVRFMHQQIATVLARSALRDDPLAASTLVHPRKAQAVVDGRVRSDSTGWSGTFLSRVSTDGAHPPVVVLHALFELYGRHDPAAAERILRAGRGRWLTTPLVALLAEAVWCAGRWDEAGELWNEAAGRYPENAFVANKLIRWYATSGDLAGAAKALERLVSHRPHAEYARLLSAELGVRHGTPPEVDAAVQELRSLQDAADVQARLRATLELARLADDVAGEPERAVALLQPLLPLGLEHGLIFSRLAACHLAAGRRDRAVGMAKVAYDNWEWGTDPRHQLEVLVVAAALLGDADAEAQCLRLQRFGWRLDGRAHLHELLVREGLPPQTAQLVFTEGRVDLGV